MDHDYKKRLVEIMGDIQTGATLIWQTPTEGHAYITRLRLMQKELREVKQEVIRDKNIIHKEYIKRKKKITNSQVIRLIGIIAHKESAALMRKTKRDNLEGWEKGDLARYQKFEDYIDALLQQCDKTIMLIENRLATDAAYQAQLKAQKRPSSTSDISLDEQETTGQDGAQILTHYEPIPEPVSFYYLHEPLSEKEINGSVRRAHIYSPESGIQPSSRSTSSQEAPLNPVSLESAPPQQNPLKKMKKWLRKKLK